MGRFRGVRNFASLDGNAKRLEDAFASVFVDVHAKWVVRIGRKGSSFQA